MKLLLTGLDTLTHLTGRLLSWLMYATMLSTASVVVLRYIFNSGSIALQESATYSHALVLLLCMGFAQQQGAHVRVDIFYRRMSARARAWVDALGGLLFTLPLSLFLILSSWDFVAQSWAMGEHSAEADGLPAVYLLKALIPLGAALLALHTLSEVLSKTVDLCTEADDA